MGYREAETPSCPACTATALSERRGFGLHSLRCGACRGHWLDWPEVYRQLESRGVGRDRLVFESMAGASARRCPICNAALSAETVLETEHPVLDTCAQHGIWFDHHELGLALDAAEIHAPRAEVKPPPKAQPEPAWSAWRHLLELIGMVETTTD